MSNENGKYIMLRIILDPKTGQVGVDGPMDNKLLCLGMISMAEKIIHDFKIKEKPMVDVVPANVVQLKGN